MWARFGRLVPGFALTWLSVVGCVDKCQEEYTSPGLLCHGRICIGSLKALPLPAYSIIMIFWICYSASHGQLAHELASCGRDGN